MQSTALRIIKLTESPALKSNWQLPNWWIFDFILKPISKNNWCLHLSGSQTGGYTYAMLPALDAILGHRSAHSFDTGPVMAEPFISPLLFTITPALSSKYKNVPSLRRIVLRCRMTTAGITFFLNERNRVGRFLQNVMGVNEMALPQFGLSFFDGGKHHVPICSGWETIEAPTYSSDGNNIKVLCS